MSDWTEEDEKKAVDFWVNERMKFYIEGHPDVSDEDKAKQREAYRLDAWGIMKDAKKEENDRKIRYSFETRETMMKSALRGWTEEQLKDIDYQAFFLTYLECSDKNIDIDKLTLAQYKEMAWNNYERAKREMLDPDKAKQIHVARVYAEGNAMWRVALKSWTIAGAKVSFSTLPHSTAAVDKSKFSKGEDGFYIIPDRGGRE